MTHKDQCYDAALRNGWAITRDTTHASFTKGPRTLRIQFSERGTIVSAETLRRQIAGTGKLDRILLEFGA